MCGRFAQGLGIDELPDVFISTISADPTVSHSDERTPSFDIKQEQEEGEIPQNESERNEVDEHVPDVSTQGSYKPSFNISPTKGAPVIYVDDQRKKSEGNLKYIIEASSFGLVPKWINKKTGDSGDAGDNSKEVYKNQWKYFNCRIESLENTSGMWKDYKMNRCVVPIQGYYEWLHKDGQKIPYYCSCDKKLMFLVGLFSHNNSPKSSLEAESSSFTIITCPAEKEDKDDLSWLHSRRPLVITPDSKEWLNWLNPSRENAQNFHEILTSLKTTKVGLTTHIVTKDVGKISNDGEYLTKKVEEKKRPQKSIIDFFPPAKRKKVAKNIED